MLLGIRTRRQILARHLLVGLLSVGVVLVGWLANASWDPEMRLWKGFGVGSMFLLWVATMLGPAARLVPPLGRFLPWRREFGVWFALVAVVHAYLVWDGWARWDVQQLLGYQYVPEMDAYLRFEPGFGLANLMGLVALLFGLVLAATSFDRAVSFLGMSAWKWLHGFAYVIFYLVALHVLYFVFIHYTPSPHRVLMGQSTIYPVNTLLVAHVVMVLSVPLAQSAAFVVTVVRRRRVGR